MQAYRIVIIMLLGLLAALPRPADAQTFGDINVNAISTSTGASTGGYVEHRFIITNRSAEHDRHVAITMPATTWGGGAGHYLRGLRRAVIVPADSTVELPILQPPLPLNGDGARIVIDGQTQRGQVGISGGRHGHTMDSWYRGIGDDVAVLASPSITGELRDRLEAIVQAETATSTRYGSRGMRELHRANRPPRQWSDNWLAYSAYAGLVLRSEELDEMPRAAREAMWQYVTAGGTLLVLGDARPVPEPWQQRHERVLFAGEATDRYAVGFGQCWFMPADRIDATRRNADATNELARYWASTAQVINRYESVEQANRRFSIVEHLTVPVRGLLALMLVFTLVIGPTNLVVVSKLNRRIWMLWTVPVIAMLFAGAVFGYATFAEGWQADRRLTGLTLLDETNRRATTLGWAAYYSPLTPGDGLRFSHETEVTPQVRLEGWSSDGSVRFVDWTHDQHLSGGWISARVPAHFSLRKSETRRERLTLDRNEAGQVTVTNALGADIIDVYIADREGRVHHVRHVPAGGRATLASLEQYGNNEADLREMFENDWPRMIERMADESDRYRGPALADYLRPNTYLAVVEGSPFLEPGLASARPRPSQSVVYGILAEGFHGD
ncbi:hypothetical protein ACERK3_09840 [Phycisphaerales bacterium AB-hyl4]|uniref:Uncharacterized protein n=1 Tax=Natronomicrosphaera hydrolytica TaxID=3242702 RepID=A0ABV4U4Y1_9BACT